MSDKEKTSPPAGAAATTASIGPMHRYEPHEQDLVAVEVVFAQGVRQHGKVYQRGEALVLKRGYAKRRNRPGRPVFRVLGTVRYHKGPADQAEEALEEGPLDLDAEDAARRIGTSPYAAASKARGAFRRGSNRPAP